MAGIDNNTVLYLRGDSFKDLSLNPKSITNNGVTISENGKFSKGLVLGSNQYMQIINGMQGVDLSKDFTIEWWEYSTLKSSNSAIFTNKINAGSFSVGFLLGFEGTKTFMGNSSVNWNGFDATVSKDKTDNIWVHWRFVKKGTQWMSYKNGIKFWATTTTVTPGKSDGDNCTIGAWLENSTIKSGYNAIISDFRISNIARCSEDFTPPTQPFNSIDINITNQTYNQVDFNVTKLGQETINKVEVLQNNIVKETYTDNYNNLTYNIDSSLCAIGNNKITIRVTYDDNYIEEKVLTHTVTVNNLPTTSSLKDVIDRQELLNNNIEIQKNNLKNILVGKNVEVSEEDKFSDLIDKVDKLPSIKVIEELQNNQHQIAKKVSILEAENEKLKLEQEQQNEEILVNMLANTEMFEMILGMIPMTLSEDDKTKNNGGNSIIEVYCTLIIKGVKTIEDVPLVIREQVIEKLKQLEVPVK